MNKLNGCGSLLPQRSIRSSKPAVKFSRRGLVAMLLNSTLGLNQSSRQFSACSLLAADQLSQLNKCDESIDHRVRRSIEQFARIADFAAAANSITRIGYQVAAVPAGLIGRWAVHIEQKSAVQLAKAD
jgi:hypothetical protein